MKSHTGIKVALAYYERDLLEYGVSHQTASLYHVMEPRGYDNMQVVDSSLVNFTMIYPKCEMQFTQQLQCTKHNQ